MSTSLFITRFDLNNRSDLAAVPTHNLPIGTVFQFIAGDGPSSIGVVAEFQEGTANIDDVSQVAPNDSTITHWQVVAGYLAV